MKPLIVLFVAFSLSLIIIRWITGQFNLALSGRISLGIMLCFTALGHFMFTEGMSKMIMDFLPYKRELVLTTGVLEILFGLALMYPNVQLNKMVGISLMLFFILIVPGNIKAAMENLNYQTGNYDGPGLLYLWFRIPFQVLLIVWSYFSTINPGALMVKPD